MRTLGIALYATAMLSCYHFTSMPLVVTSTDRPQARIRLSDISKSSKCFPTLPTRRRRRRRNGVRHAFAAVGIGAADTVCGTKRHRQPEHLDMGRVQRLCLTQPGAVHRYLTPPQSLLAWQSGVLAGRRLVRADGLLQRRQQQFFLSFFLFRHPGHLVPMGLRRGCPHHTGLGQPADAGRAGRQLAGRRGPSAAAHNFRAGARLYDCLLGRPRPDAAAPAGAAARRQPAIQSALRRRPDAGVHAGTDAPVLPRQQLHLADARTRRRRLAVTLGEHAHGGPAADGLPHERGIGCAAARLRGAADGAVCRSALGLLPAPAPARWRGIDCDACTGLADLFDARAFISAPLPLRRGEGRIYVVSAKHRFTRSDATFLHHLAAQAFPAIENIELLDRLASEAAFRERQKIARDLHDTAIQPYIGLRHGLSALRQRAEADNALLPDIDKLLSMTTEVIADMRHFARNVRVGDAREVPELLVALRLQAAQVRDFYDIDITIESSDKLAVSDRLAAEVFQIVNEGMSNIRKHTDARRGCITLSRNDNMLQIRIENDNPEHLVPDFLPGSIAERAAALGGTVAVTLSPAAMTVIQIDIPL